MNNSFSKKLRLITREDFDNNRKKSSLLRSKYFLFFYNLNEFDNSRLGLKISKKAGNAVRRNFLKRHLRECFRKSDLVNKNYDIVAIINQRNIKCLKSAIELDLDISNAFNSLSKS